VIVLFVDSLRVACRAEGWRPPVPGFCVVSGLGSVLRRWAPRVALLLGSSVGGRCFFAVADSELGGAGWVPGVWVWGGRMVTLAVMRVVVLSGISVRRRDGPGWGLWTGQA